MGFVIGRGRYGRTTYPVAARSFGSSNDYDVLVPQMFGAVADGQQDDTVAMQQFLDATRVQGRKGRVPAGTYLITAPLYSHDPGGSPVLGGNIEGDGRGITTLLWGGPVDDGTAMLTWSRRQSDLTGLTFLGGAGLERRASHGLVIQDGGGARVRVDVQQSRSHGIVFDGLWEGLPYGFNENLVLYQTRVDFCGVAEIQQVLLTGDGLGGTFVLDFDGNATAPIAVGADAATVAAALLTANPGLASPSTAQGGTGNNPFVVTGGPGNWVIKFWGLASGAQPLIVLDTSSVTGTITTANVVRASAGSRANGVQMLPRDVGGADWGTTALFEPACRQNVGHGLHIIGQGIKVWGGHIEGNTDSGIHFNAIEEPAGFSLDNMVHWPWLEANYTAGATARRTTRSWFAHGSGFQALVNTDSADVAVLLPGNGSYSMYQRGATGYVLQLGAPGEPRVLGFQQNGTTKRPTQVDSWFDQMDTFNQTVDGPRTLDVNRRRNFRLVMNADITSLSITGAVQAQETVLTFETTVEGPKTVGWPANIRWAGGVAPAIGSGGNGTIDVIALAFRSGLWVELYRTLAVGP